MHSLYYCVNNNMVYGFNSTNNQFTYINKKSINILLYCTILPISFLISKILKIQFQDKSNPLNKLGILFSVNQMIYLLIAMWIYPTMPDKMLMVIAMIFGAHLLPYSWLYNSENIYGIVNNYSNINSNSWFKLCKLYSCNNDDSNRNNI